LKTKDYSESGAGLITLDLSQGKSVVKNELSYRIYRIYFCPSCENFCWDYKKGEYVGKCKSDKQEDRIVQEDSRFNLTNLAPPCDDFRRGAKRAKPCRGEKKLDAILENHHQKMEQERLTYLEDKK